MSYKTLRLSRLPVNWQEQPQLFERYWDETMTSLEKALNSILSLPAIQAAIDAATTAAATANTAAASASTAAAAAQGSVTASTKENALINSYITPSSVLSATPTLITVAAHTRRYADGTSAAVSGGTVAATAATDVDFISYLDSARTGGAVTYTVSTTQPSQTLNRHVVGAITIPGTGTSSGGTGPRPPGYVAP